jgi:hypothetical protein|tara:strand:+ start:19940 stop:20611 length:672 start_codon:yes stop_codon:yes gene_type:complete
MIRLLSSTAYLIVNKQLSKKVGLQAAALLADLISKQEYFINEYGITEYFFNTEPNITKDTTLSVYQQRACITKLKALGLISVKLMGIPAKRHFKINADAVMELLNNKSYTKPITINKNKVNKNKVNNSTNSNTIAIRKLFFKGEVENLGQNILDKEELTKFLNYWTEPNKSNTKMRYEQQRTWSTELRINNWHNNNKKWSTGKNTQSKIDIQLSEYQKGKKLL